MGARRGSTPPSVTPRDKESAAVERVVAANRALIERLPAAVVQDLAQDVDLIEKREETTGESPLTGKPLPDGTALHAVRLANLRRSFAERRTLLEDTVGVRELAEILGVGRQTPHDRYRARTLLAMKDQGNWRFPIWQLDPEGPDGVVAGLPQVLKALNGPMTDLGRMRWFTTAKPLLDGRSPLEALRDGDIDEAIAEAEAVGAS